ncbi:MAG TPA: response regulator [Blastocatellia bacterium]|nr:response regulator [Blastocatellia bacterium]
MVKSTVLVVEDNPDSQYLLQVMLESEGWIVMTASDGERAIQMLHEFKSDVVITDLLLPVVSGGDLIRYIRSTAELSQIPIVVLSAYSNSYESEAMAAGATAVLKKPLDGDILLDTLRKVNKGRSHTPSPSQPHESQAQ